MPNFPRGSVLDPGFQGDGWGTDQCGGAVVACKGRSIYQKPKRRSGIS